MKERPIIFSAPMVRAMLDGSKTQTRRVAKLTDAAHVKEPNGHRRWHPGDPDASKACPYGQPGGRLWVRETWAAPHSEDGRPPRAIQCDQMRIHYSASEDRGGLLWRPSIHMPRWASRTTLEITGVRVERLENISEADAMAEGIATVVFRPDTGWPLCNGFMAGPDDGNTCLETSAVRAYRSLWESINGPGSWDANPWVWVIEFKVL